MQNLYLFVRQDKHQILTRLKQYFKVGKNSLNFDDFKDGFNDDKDIDDDVTINDENEDDDDYDEKFFSNLGGYAPLNFQVTLTMGKN